jgi:hypothetical protein
VPGKTLAQQYLAALRYLRQHPDASDDQVADACGIHRFERQDTITPARRTLAGEAGDSAGSAVPAD